MGVECIAVEAAPYFAIAGSRGEVTVHGKKLPPRTMGLDPLALASSVLGLDLGDPVAACAAPTHAAMLRRNGKQVERVEVVANAKLGLAALGDVRSIDGPHGKPVATIARSKLVPVTDADRLARELDRTFADLERVDSADFDLGWLDLARRLAAQGPAMVPLLVRRMADAPSERVARVGLVALGMLPCAEAARAALSLSAHRSAEVAAAARTALVAVGRACRPELERGARSTVPEERAACEHALYVLGAPELAPLREVLSARDSLDKRALAAIARDGNVNDLANETLIRKHGVGAAAHLLAMQATTSSEYGRLRATLEQARSLPLAPWLPLVLLAELPLPDSTLLLAASRSMVLELGRAVFGEAFTPIEAASGQFAPRKPGRAKSTPRGVRRR